MTRRRRSQSKNAKAGNSKAVKRGPAKKGEISKKQKTLNERLARSKTDALLEHLLEEHKLWLCEKAPLESRLTWEKLKSVFEVYKDRGWGNPDLSGAEMRKMVFFGAEIEDISFSGANLSDAVFRSVNFRNIDFSECILLHVRFFNSKFLGCNFSEARLIYAFSRDTRMIFCNFKNASFENAQFLSTSICNSLLLDARLPVSSFVLCSIVDSDCTGADFSYSRLNKTGFLNSVLTGACLYGIGHADWELDNIECKYVYLDIFGKERFPPKRDFEEGQFMTLYKSYREFSYVFNNGMTVFDFALSSHIINEINELDLGFEVKVDSASFRGTNPVLNFVILSGDSLGFKAKELFTLVFEQKIKNIKSGFEKDKLHFVEDFQSDSSRQPSSGSSLNAMVRKQTGGGMDSIAGRPYEDQALIVRTVSKLRLQELESEIKEYDYLAVFGLGKNAKEISQEELDWICVDLSKAMPPKCLLASQTQLDEMETGTFARNAFGIFNERSKRTFIAIASITRGVNDRIYRKPVYHALTLLPENEFIASIENFINGIKYQSSTDFQLRSLHPKQESLVFPNSDLIKTLREKKGSQEAVSKDHFKNSNRNGDTNISESSLKKAENNKPVQYDVLDDIACYLKRSVAELTFVEVVPNQEELRALKGKTGLSTEKLAMRFGVPSCFFDSIERDKTIPAATLIDLYNHYRKLFKELNITFEYSFKDLVNLDETKAFRQKPL